MNDTPSNDPLAKPLQRQAAGMNEPFSDSLHAGVMRRVRASRIAPASTFNSRPLIACAAVVLVASVIGWLGWDRTATVAPSPVPPTPTIVQVGDTNPPVEDAADPLQASIARAMPTGALASVDQDVRSLGSFVMAQLNALPGSPRKDLPSNVR